MVSIETLLYIIQGDRVLLIEKKKGLGKGLYNGVGGKVEEGETPLEAAIRECKEEIGVIPRDPEWMGILEFYNDGELYGYVHIFISRGFDGVPRESDEAKPVWFTMDSLPYDNMWEDDRYWLPLVLLQNRKIYARFDFEDDWGRLVKKEIYILELVS